MIKNNLKILKDLILEIQQFRKYLNTEFNKFVNLYCRKTKRSIIFKNEKKANYNNTKKVYRDFLKTTYLKEYKRFLKIINKYSTFFYYNEDCEIDIYKIRRKECKIDIFDGFQNVTYFDINNNKIELRIFEYSIDIMRDVYIFMTLDEDKMSIEEIKRKEIINNIIGIIYNEE